MGQEASVSMRCPPHHTHPASITTKLRRFLRKRRRFSKFSPTFFGKCPTFFGKRPMFLLNAWRSMNLTSEECFIVLQIFVFSTSLARARARTPQRFCAFCFHNLHRLPLSTPYFQIKIKELSYKKVGDFSWNLRHLWEYLRHFFTSLLSVSKMLLVIGGNSLCFLPSFIPFCHDLLKVCYNKRVTHLFQAI